MDRDEDGVAGSEGVEREEIERWRAVQKDEFILIPEAGQQVLESVISLVDADQLDRTPDEVFVGGNELQPLHLRLLDDPLEWFAEDKGLVESSTCRIFSKSYACGCIGLGVAINEECSALGGGD